MRERKQTRRIFEAFFFFVTFRGNFCEETTKQSGEKTEGTGGKGAEGTSAERGGMGGRVDVRHVCVPNGVSRGGGPSSCVTLEERHSPPS